MDKALYTAVSGASETMIAQAIHSHNLANVNTVGFRADLEHFSHKAIEGAGLQTRSLVVNAEQLTNFQPGAMMSTHRELDFAIEDQGFFAIQTPSGEEAYTRAGDLKIQADGLLVTRRGDPVIGDGGIVSIPPAEKIEFGSDGTISIVPIGAPADALAVIDRIKLVNPPIENLQKREDGRIYTKDNSIAEADASVTIVSGMLETSNVNPVEEMLTIMSLSRSFEMQVKLIENLKQNETNIDKILQFNG